MVANFDDDPGAVGEKQRMRLGIKYGTEPLTGRGKQKGEKCNGPKCALVKRNYPAGVLGLIRKRSKQSVYGRQLAEKQKAKEDAERKEKEK